jgi:hypothetical protein
LARLRKDADAAKAAASEGHMEQLEKAELERDSARSELEQARSRESVVENLLSNTIVERDVMESQVCRGVFAGAKDGVLTCFVGEGLLRRSWSEV